MRLTPWLLAVATALGTGAAFTVTGCAGTGTLIVEDEPPPAREEVVVVRPGFVFIHGHWDRHGGRWSWEGGRYERERVGHTYHQGHWERHPRGHIWIQGGWTG